MPEVVVRSPLDLRWESVMEGAEMAVLYGDPARSGAPYVIRFRTDRQIQVPLHWHREDEHITVLHGPYSLGFEQPTGHAKPALMEDGSYVVVPAGVRHVASYGPGTVVQVSGTGPFESTYVDPATELADRAA